MTKTVVIRDTSSADLKVSLDAGTAMLLSNGDVGTFTFPSTSEILSLSMPRPALEPLLGDRDPVLARAVPRDTGALRLLVRYLDIFKEAGALATPELQRLAAAHVSDLLNLTLVATRDAAAPAQGRGVRAARLRAIKADIVGHLSDASLSVSAVARRQGVSDSYIRRLFQSEDTSFTEFVLEARLACAHRWLTDSRYAGCTIAAIAFEAGFGDLSYFNRCVRRRSGDTPAGARAGVRPSRASSSPTGCVAWSKTSRRPAA